VPREDQGRGYEKRQRSHRELRLETNPKLLTNGDLWLSVVATSCCFLLRYQMFLQPTSPFSYGWFVGT
jgi:hypothetical protein